MFELTIDARFSAAHAIRKRLAGCAPLDARNELIGLLKQTRTNAELVERIAKDGRAP